MNEKILVVDDDEVLSHVLQRVLCPEGYIVLHAENVAQAVQVDQLQQPKLALLDLCLPDGDGVQLAAALQAQHPGLPLILMTAYPLRLRENFVGADRFVRILTKPLNVKELRQAIRASMSLADTTDLPAAGATGAVALPSEVPALSFFRS